MKLGEFVTAARKARRHPVTREVTFRVLALVDPDNNQTAPIEVKALLRFVSDEVRNRAVAEADKATDQDAPHDVRSSMREYHFLCEVLRDAANPGEPFADTPDELAQVLVGRERERIASAYGAFVEEEFPDEPKKADLDDLVKQAGNG